jgi:S-sulfo-L-cysteine synthase (3-phospho-L-serine-dependent)
MHIAFIESNTTGTGRLTIQRLLSEGHRVTFVTRNPSMYPFLTAPARGLETVEIDTNDVDATSTWLDCVRVKASLDALVTFSTYYVPAVAMLADRFGYRYLNPQTARACHDKYACRVALLEAGMPVPRFWSVRSESDAEQISRVAIFPCVMKPATDSGSTGVKLLRDRNDFLAHYRALAARGRNERGQPAGGILVEGWLDGPEFSVETFTTAARRTHVVGVTAKHLGCPPWFVETGHDFPAPLKAGARQWLERAAVAALDAVGYDFGPAHVELRMTGTGPMVVEINPRLAGGMIPELVRYASGVDMVAALFDGLTGRAVNVTPTRHEAASIRFVTAARSGRLLRRPPIDAVRRLPLVREVECDLEVERPLRRAESAADRCGFVITSGPDSDAVIAAADAAHARLALDVS